MKEKDIRRVLPARADAATAEVNSHIAERKRANKKNAAHIIYKCPQVSGLELRVTNTTAAWELLYNIKIGDKWSKRRIKVGSFTDFPISEIRKRAQAYRVEISNGGDPVIEKKERALQRQYDLDAAMTVTSLFELWINDKSMTDRKTGIKEPSRMMRKDVLPALGKLEVKSITGRHLIAVRDEIAVRGPRIANITISLVRQMFGFAVKRFLIDELPQFPEKVKENKPCDRVLAIDEIVELFEKIPAARLANTTVLALKMQLATGCRVGELLIAEWSHVCLESGEWHIPTTNSKTGAELTVYLSDYGLGLFKQLYSLSGYQQWLFPNGSETGHIDKKSVTKQVRDRQRGGQLAGRSRTPDALILKGGSWTPHDLRRTSSSTMQALLINPYIVERCLNHAVEKMARVYMPKEPEIEMYRAWQALGEILAICDSDKGGELARLAADNEKRSIRDRLGLAELLPLVNSNKVIL